jgi:hypothetical protein
MPPRPDNVEPALFDLLAARGSTDFVVVMAEQADLSAAYAIDDWNARGRAVYDALRETASRTQAPLAAYAGRNALAYRSFFSENTVYVEGGTLRAALDLASLPGVALVRTPREAHITPAFVAGPTAPDSYGWNLDALKPGYGQYGMQAAQVWADYDVRGEGIVVANIDTGVYYEHDAVIRQYRGNLGSGIFDHDYNWYMPTSGCGDGTYPCDNNSHGTGTIGIMIGETADLSEQTGAAPAAQWIACKGCEGTVCTEPALLGCADWILAPCPIGTDPGSPACDPDMRPHIVNNSWGDAGGDDWYRSYIQAWVAAGIFPAFSAGNSLGCSVLGSPGDNPEAFGTAAHDSSGRHHYAGGPSVFFPEPSCDPNAHEVDPHLSAPTFGRAPSNSDDAYFSLSGTSGASPHTAGAVALIWSAAPALIGDIDTTFTVLEQSTNHDVPAGYCGKPGCAGSEVYPNYSYGWGYLDARAAVEMATQIGATARLEGTVTDSSTGAPLSGVDVVVTLSTTIPLQWSTVTDAGGDYHVDAFSGTCTLDASTYGYWPAQESDVALTAGVTTIQDIALMPRTFYTVSGVVTDAVTGWPLHARIDIDGYPGSPVWTDPVTGHYAVALAEGIAYTFDVTAWTAGYESSQRIVGPLAADRVEDFALLPDEQDCIAPGRYRTSEIYETFDFPETPAGWSIVDNAGQGQVWRFDDPEGWGNLTGGTGGFAIVDSYYYGPGGNQDTELRSPAMDFTGYDDVALMFQFDFYWFAGDPDEIADVDISVDGGSSWTNVWRRSSRSYRGPRLEEIDLTAEVAGEADVMVRFRYYNASYQLWWQVDDVFVGDPMCRVAPGGLVAGTVVDARTGAGLAGATVVDESGSQITSSGTGGYAFFEPAGTHTFTATLPGYVPSVVTATAVASETVRRDIPLAAGYLTFSPAGLGTTLDMEMTATLPITVANAGVLPVTYVLTETFGGPVQDVAWLSAEPVTGTLPVSTSHRISVTFDAGAATVTQPGDHVAWLAFDSDSPYTPDLVPVTMTVRAPDSWGKLEGVVSSSGYCDANPYPLAGAEVQIESGDGVSWTVTTTPDGTYERWLDEAYSPLTVTVSHPDHTPATVAGVTINRGITTTEDFAVRWLRPCVSVDIDSISETLWIGTGTVMSMTITNSGVVSTPFVLREFSGDTGGCTGGEDVGWLYELPASGSAAAEDAVEVNLGVNALPTMGAGAYDAVLSLCTSDPVNGLIVIPVHLQVAAETSHLPVVMRE